MRLLFCLAALAALATGCSEPPPTACDDTTGQGCVDHEIVAGVDLTALLRRPTAEDVLAVTSTWPTSDPSRVISAMTPLDLGDRETATVLRGGASGGATSFLGVVRQPPRESGDQRLRPLLVFFPDAADVDLGTITATLPIRQDVRDEVVLLIVVRRGGSIRVGDQLFATTSANADPLAPAAAFDALALVRYARDQAEPFRIARERVGFVGDGTGGHTALVAGARSPVDDYLLAIAAPSSFFTLGVYDAARAYLQGNAYAQFPGLTATFDRLLAPIRDGALSVEAARDSLIARSPAVLLPTPAPPAAFLFAVHGQEDLVVPQEQGRALVPVIQETGGLSLIKPGAVHETLLQDPEVLSSGFPFLCNTLFVGEPFCPS